MSHMILYDRAATTRRETSTAKKITKKISKGVHIGDRSMKV